MHATMCQTQYLNRDVCVEVSPVKDCPEVELRISILLKHPRPDSVILTPHNSIHIRGCVEQIMHNLKMNILDF